MDALVEKRVWLSSYCGYWSSKYGFKSWQLCKLEVPTFNGEILRWRTFWDMFQVSIQKQETMSSAEKRQAISGGPAAEVIEALCNSSNQYEEAISCLRNRYSTSTSA